MSFNHLTSKPLGTNGINVAHELGHRKTKWERFLAKLLLMPSLYMHFYIEHNFGHHLNVGTPDDPATSKKKSISFFILVHFHNRSNKKCNSNSKKSTLKNKKVGFLVFTMTFFYYQIFQLCIFNLYLYFF